MNDDHDHIDLGVSRKELFGGGMPQMAVTSPERDDPDKKEYPSFRYEGPEELDLPESGKMEVHFIKRSETSRTRPDGSHWYECCIEVQKLGCVCSDEPDKPASSGGNGAAEALDTLARALGKERGEEY